MVVAQSALLADLHQGRWVDYRLHPHLPDWVCDMLRTVLANKNWLRRDAERLVQALRTKAIQHPAHVARVGRIDAA